MLKTVYPAKTPFCRGYNMADEPRMQKICPLSELSLGRDLGEKVSISWLTSPYLKLREKITCIKHIGKSKIWTKTSL